MIKICQTVSQISVIKLDFTFHFIILRTKTIKGNKVSESNFNLSSNAHNWNKMKWKINSVWYIIKFQIKCTFNQINFSKSSNFYLILNYKIKLFIFKMMNFKAVLFAMNIFEKTGKVCLSLKGILFNQHAFITSHNRNHCISLLHYMAVMKFWNYANKQGMSFYKQLLNIYRKCLSGNKQ